MIIPLWLSESWRSFLYISSVYSCHLLVNLMLGPTISVLYCAHLCMKCSLSISNFPEEISSFSHSLFSSVSLQCSLTKAFLSLLVILWKSAFRWVYLSLCPLPLASLLFSAVCKASSDDHFALLHFFFLGVVFVTTSLQCQEPPSLVLRALSVRSNPWIYVSLPLYNHKGLY